MIARNINKRRGPQVTLPEIAACAKPTCPSCNGTGVLRQYPVGRPEAVTERGCGCAAARFVRQHPEVIVSEEGYAWWPAPDAEQPTPKAPPPLAGLEDEEDTPGPDTHAPVSYTHLTLPTNSRV